MSQRRVKRTNRKPSFFWQGVLILAPMLVLAKLGALAIWQDKRMAQHDAELRAQDIAEEVADILGRELILATNQFELSVDAQGQLLSPPPYNRTPTPQPLDLAQLSPEQRTWWQTGKLTKHRAARLEGREEGAAFEEGVSAYRSFIASTPPTNFIAAAHLALGMLLLNHFGDKVKAAQKLEIVVKQFPSATTESGLPMLPLARTRLFEATGIIDRNFASSLSNTIETILQNPCALSEDLLKLIWPGTNASPDWSTWPRPIPGRQQQREIEAVWTATFLTKSNALHRWNEEEQLRRIYEAARPMLVPPSGLGVVSLTNSFRLPITPPRPPSLFWITLPVDRLLTNAAAISTHSPPTRKQTNEPALRWATIPETNRNDISVLTGDERWLISRSSGESGARLQCRSEPALKKMAEAALTRVHMPEYFDASVRLANADLISSNTLLGLEHLVIGKGGGQTWRRTTVKPPPAVIATASRATNGEPLLSVAVHLVGPDMLFEQQHTRSVLFGSMIGLAVLAAVVGFVSAWRAFHKQLRLAEMKSNFVSSVSHELRAPIASVRLMAEGLERGKISEPAKQHEYFRFIVQECRRLSSMIENVLDFARIEQGRKQYEFEPTDVGALVTKTVKLMEPYAEERGVVLKSKVESQKSSASVPPASRRVPGDGETEARQDAGGTLAANIDGQAIQQALVNLIDNAIKHSPSGEEVLIEVEFPNPQSEIRNLKFHVTDHGPGIPIAEHEKIFERFYRLGSELRRETPGVGIGLSIVKHVVEAHDGHVRVESEVGKGSCFIMELPLNVPPASGRPGLEEMKTRQEAGGAL